MRKWALDMSLYPLPYAGGELPETNIGLMPGLVSSYDQGLAWKKKPIGKALTDFLAAANRLTDDEVTLLAAAIALKRNAEF